MGSAVVSLLQRLYFDEASARTLLFTIGFPPAKIPAFQSAATFWPEVVLKLENGIIIDGIPKVLKVVAEEHPGDEMAQTLAIEFTVKIRLPNATDANRSVKVLCLFADPVPGSTIRIDREARLLREIEALGGIAVATRHAVRTSDFIRTMLDEKPQILHFAGHGTPDGRLVFDGEDGRQQTVYPAVLARAIAATITELLDCVVLNSCYTGANAESFRGVTRSVAGSVTALKDDCALAFARGFYTGVAHGQQPVRAFQSGHAEMGFPGCDTSGLHFDSFAGDDND